ncbi:hypothetical protein HanPSC8_Chr08g0308121 [Helianthus annuus]|nr:hypothetical protein HanPSC8_Chr08g0308121 [Helianthus annuus]
MNYNSCTCKPLIESKLLNFQLTPAPVRTRRFIDIISPAVFNKMAGCDVTGGCPSDYVALSVAIISFILLLLRSTLPFIIHKVPRPKGSSFWLPTIQILASFNLLLSLVVKPLSFFRTISSCFLVVYIVDQHLCLGKLHFSSFIFVADCNG